MPNRIVTYAAAIVLGLIGTAGLLSSSVQAADECLAAPKGAAPQGSHWYYHLERQTGHKCWYLGSQGALIKHPAVAAAPASNKPAETMTPPPSAQSLQPNVANAHAEWQSAAPTDATPSSSAVNPLSNQADGNPASAMVPMETLNARWPDTNAFRPSTDGSQKIAQNSAPPPAADSQPNTQQTASASQPPAAAAVAQNTPEPSTGAVLTPLRIVLAVLFVLLAIAALSARSVVRYVANKRRKPVSRRDIWAQADYEEMPSPSYSQMVTPQRRARDLGEPNAATDEIEYLLRRAAERDAHARHVSS